MDDKIPKGLSDFDPDSDLTLEDLGILTDLRERDIMINPMLFQTSSSRFDRALRNKKVHSRQTPYFIFINIQMESGLINCIYDSGVLNCVIEAKLLKNQRTFINRSLDNPIIIEVVG